MNGTLSLIKGHWLIEGDPDVLRSARNRWPQVSLRGDSILLPADPHTSYQLSYFASEYDLNVSHIGDLDQLSDLYRNQLKRLRSIFSDSYEPQPLDLAVDARSYQRVAADWISEARRGLLADDIGLGKTVSAISCIVRTNSLPAIVVCPPHVVRHWRECFERFAPQLRVHVIDSANPYRLPAVKGRLPEVLVCNYEKLIGWADVFSSLGSFVVWDEVQGLRRARTQKSKAAIQIASKASHVLGLSATPIWNLGGEFWNVFEAIHPGRLGTWPQFARQWCSTDEENPSDLALNDPAAFGCWLRKHFLMLRRSRKDVGRELGKLNRIVETIDFDPDILDREMADVVPIARKAVRHEQFAETGDFQRLSRQATGIAKAPAVAAFVNDLVEAGEPVVLFGFHHRVYQEWARLLAPHDPVFFTGMQTAHQKEDAIERFRSGRSKVLVLSVAAGAGLDGLQHCCRTVVIGELTWTEEEINQCIGRVDRDGQEHPVTAYILTSDAGLDPSMLARARLKGEQSAGLLADEPVREFAERFIGKARSA